MVASSAWWVARPTLVAPVERRPLRWITFGSALVVASSVGTSLVLAWYLTAVADYGSIFGALAIIVVVLTYLYFAAAAFLTGPQLDAVLRERFSDPASA